MKISNKMYIMLQQAREDIRKSTTPFRARLYLIGKNKSGVCMELVRLFSDSGCAWVPGISSEELSRAMIILLNNKLTVAGFALIDIYCDMKPHWGNEHGNDIFRYELPFLICSNSKMFVQQYKPANGVVTTTEVSIVGKKST